MNQNNQMSNDRSICQSVRLAMDKIEEQPGLGHNVVQGRLFDIHELSHQLLIDLDTGVYGTTRKMRIKPEPPYKPNPHLPEHTKSPADKLLDAIRECVGIDQGVLDSASSIIVHVVNGDATTIELRHKGDVYLSRQRKHGGTFYSI
jgi:hypothetical protein